jgi:DNA polymerase/3'-5' exonuclease PolX
MNKGEDFSKIIVKNPDNKYIVDEFIRYYMFVYSNYTQSSKSSKENYYKLLVIKKVINLIASFKKEITSGSVLATIKGIGEKTIGRIDEIIDTGHLSEIKEKVNQVAAIKELSTIYGIGPTKASDFYENYKIKSIKDLIKADKKGLIELTNQMKLGIKYKDILSEHIPRILIARLDLFVQEELMKLDPNFISVVCGSYRRGKDYSSDIDILITNKKLKSKEQTGKYLKIVLDKLEKFFIIDKLTESYNTHFQGFASFKKIPDLPKSYNHKEFNVNINVIRLDIIIVPEQYFFPALMHFTGSGDFNQKMRLHAKTLGLKLSEYGLTKIDPKTNKEITIQTNSEADIFDVLLLKYIPPEKR